MEYGERHKGDLLAHNEVLLWALEEHAEGNYLKARKIRKVAEKMKQRFWAHRNKKLSLWERLDKRAEGYCNYRIY